MLKSSSQAGSLVDFVAIDSNHRALGDYYPRTTFSSGTGDYRIEYGANGGALGLGTTQHLDDDPRTSSWCATSRSAHGRPGGAGGPANGGQDAAAFLMASDAGTSTTWVRSRSEAAATSTGGGLGHHRAAHLHRSGRRHVRLRAGQQRRHGHLRGPRRHDGTERDRDHRERRGQDPQGARSTSCSTGRPADRHRLDAGQRRRHHGQRAVGGVQHDGRGHAAWWGRESRPCSPSSATGPYQTSAVASDTITLDRRPDLTTTAVSNPPSNRPRGGSFDIDDTAKNVGTNQAPATITRFYLSKNKSISVRTDVRLRRPAVTCRAQAQQEVQAAPPR